MKLDDISIMKKPNVLTYIKFTVPSFVIEISPKFIAGLMVV